MSHAETPSPLPERMRSCQSCIVMHLRPAPYMPYRSYTHTPIGAAFHSATCSHPGTELPSADVCSVCFGCASCLSANNPQQVAYLLVQRSKVRLHSRKLRVDVPRRLLGPLAVVNLETLKLLLVRLALRLRLVQKQLIQLAQRWRISVLCQLGVDPAQPGVSSGRPQPSCKTYTSSPCTSSRAIRRSTPVRSSSGTISPPSPAHSHRSHVPSVQRYDAISFLWSSAASGAAGGGFRRGAVSSSAPTRHSVSAADTGAVASRCARRGRQIARPSFGGRFARRCDRFLLSAHRPNTIVEELQVVGRLTSSRQVRVPS